MKKALSFVLALALVKVLDLAMAIFLPIVLCVEALKYSTVISWII